MTVEVFTKMINWIVNFINTLKELFTKLKEDVSNALK